MQIEITTTKKKLSKSLINQMQSATRGIILTGECLGYVVGCKKDSYKTAIINAGQDFFTCDLSWSKGDEAVYRKIGKWSRSIKFDSPEDCDSWWAGYRKMMKIALTTHIYV